MSWIRCPHCATVFNLAIVRPGTVTECPVCKRPCRIPRGTAGGNAVIPAAAPPTPAPTPAPVSVPTPVPAPALQATPPPAPPVLPPLPGPLLESDPRLEIESLLEIEPESEPPLEVESLLEIEPTPRQSDPQADRRWLGVDPTQPFEITPRLDIDGPSPPADEEVLALPPESIEKAPDDDLPVVEGVLVEERTEEGEEVWGIAPNERRRRPQRPT